MGNKAFKRAFHTLVGTSLRLVHGGDPIPVLPPAFVYAFSLLSVPHLPVALIFLQRVWVMSHDPAVFRVLCLGFTPGAWGDPIHVLPPAFVYASC